MGLAGSYATALCFVWLVAYAEPIREEMLFGWPRTNVACDTNC
jgi:hypothetical protein